VKLNRDLLSREEQQEMTKSGKKRARGELGCKRIRPQHFEQRGSWLWLRVSELEIARVNWIEEVRVQSIGVVEGDPKGCSTGENHRAF